MKCDYCNTILDGTENAYGDEDDQVFCTLECAIDAHRIQKLTLDDAEEIIKERETK
jgi:hypothetical protein